MSSVTMRIVKRPTITDVARTAGVSLGSVSHVLNGTTKVSTALRAKVEAAVQALGYEHNMLAHAQRRQRSPVVGLSVPHVASAYLAALIDSFEEIAAVRGYQLMQVLTRRDPEVELRRVRELLRHRVAGLLLVPTVDPSATLELIAASGTPAVLIDRPSGDGRFDEVTFDNHRIMTEAVSQLIGLGHYRILFIVEARKLSISRQRIAALHERAAAAVPQVDVFVMEVGDDPAAYAQRLTQMLEEPRDPIAVIVSNSVVASRTLRVLQTMGKDYPGRISLLAFEEPDWAELTSPQLSVIRQPVHGIAREAWELLLRRMHGEHSPVQHLELRAEITLRGSVRKVTRKPSR
ncbi:LacI family DNA-binding transcriptional regulator [Acidisoma sp. L85]|uniref:LacI family DNA-binding transcriptional regulator n=1 Tax=Acidisoma sp. L85 TaxID=1641850 RepID=UPI00131D8905